MAQANFVLFRDGQRYYVVKRKGTKASYRSLERFVGFFETADKAYDQAIDFTTLSVANLRKRLADLKHKKLKGEIYA